jgi:cytochrome c oxidase assembly protein subunit 11
MADTRSNKPSSPQPQKARQDIVVAAACGVFVAAMVGAAYAAVPFYNRFCRTTGFAGTTQVSKVAPAHAIARTITVRFDANVGGGLPWRFTPEKPEIKVHIGEPTTAYYKVINESARQITAQASYNVTPPTVGAYFAKINCFCFTEQTLKPGESREMAVVFYVDPALAKDAEQDSLNTITLSYTFFSVPAKAAENAGAGRKPI